jgi:hypothetical protein
MSGAIHQLPQYTFMACCLVKHRDNFTVYLLHASQVLGNKALRKMFVSKGGTLREFMALCLHKEELMN